MKTIVLFLFTIIVFSGCVFESGKTYPPPCATYDSPNAGDYEKRLSQQEVCESKGYSFEYTERRWNQCQGHEIPYSSRCTLIENNIIVGEYVFDFVNGKTVLKKLVLGE